MGSGRWRSRRVFLGESSRAGQSELSWRERPCSGRMCNCEAEEGASSCYVTSPSRCVTAAGGRWGRGLGVLFCKWLLGREHRTNSQQSWVRLPFSEPNLRNGWDSLILTTESGGKVKSGGPGWGRGLPGGLGVAAGQDPALSLCPAPLSLLAPPPTSKHLGVLFFFFSSFLASKVFCLNGFVLRY